MSDAERQELKETLEHTERVLDTMSTFYRHSDTWRMFKGTECLERVRKSLATLKVPEPKQPECSCPEAHEAHCPVARSM